MTNGLLLSKADLWTVPTLPLHVQTFCFMLTTAVWCVCVLFLLGWGGVRGVWLLQGAAVGEIARVFSGAMQEYEAALDAVASLDVAMSIATVAEEQVRRMDSQIRCIAAHRLAMLPSVPAARATRPIAAYVRRGMCCPPYTPTASRSHLAPGVLPAAGRIQQSVPCHRRPACCGGRCPGCVRDAWGHLW